MGSCLMKLGETRQVYNLCFDRRIVSRRDDTDSGEAPAADGTWDDETLLLYDGQARWQLSEERDLLGTPDGEGKRSLSTWACPRL